MRLLLFFSFFFFSVHLLFVIDSYPKKDDASPRVDESRGSRS